MENPLCETLHKFVQLGLTGPAILIIANPGYAGTEGSGHLLDPFEVGQELLNWVALAGNIGLNELKWDGLGVLDGLSIMISLIAPPYHDQLA